MKTKPAQLLQRAKSEDGQAVILIAGLMFVFVAILAIVVETGFIFGQRRDLQNTADAAALAGVQELDGTGASEAPAIAAAIEWAEKNIPDLDETPEVTVSEGFTRIEVRVEKTSARVFNGFGLADSVVSARAVARVTLTAGQFGIIALSETQCGALRAVGTFGIEVENGDIIVNSNCDTAIEVSGAAGSAVANSTHVVGGASDPFGTFSPPPIEGSNWVPDPYEGIATPPTAPTPNRPCPGNVNGTQTLQPGTYPCQVQIGGNGTVTFAPGAYAFIGGLRITGNGSVVFGTGTYVLRGGGLAYSGGKTINASAGVLFYNTCNSGSCGAFAPGDLSNPFDHTCSTNQSSGAFSLSGNGQISIAPHPSETYLNVVFFQDRCSATLLSFTGTAGQLSASVNSPGAIYAKSAEVRYAGTALGGLQIVANTVDIRGTANLDVNVIDGETVGSQTSWALIE